MKEHPIQGELREWAKNALLKAPIFSSFNQADLEAVLSYAKVQEFNPGDELFHEGDAPLFFYLILTGEVGTLIYNKEVGYSAELNRRTALHLIGILSLFTGTSRLTTTFAITRVYALQFSKNSFDLMFEKLPQFAGQLALFLASRMKEDLHHHRLPKLELNNLNAVSPDVLEMYPPSFLMEHKIFPLKLNNNNILQLCVVEEPDRDLINDLLEYHPSLQFQIYQISSNTFEQALKVHGLYDEKQMAQHDHFSPTPNNQPPSFNISPSLSNLPSFGGSQTGLPALLPALINSLQKSTSGKPNLTLINSTKRPRLSPEEKKARLAKILPLLQEMVHQNASDLHLSAGQKIRWRIDGDLLELEKSKPFGENEVLELLEGMMPERSLLEFEEKSSTDFSYTIEDLARYRVNLYREDKGVSAALRQIPIKIPTIKELRLPQGVRALAQMPQGLVLVTGPTGSGKSTTLAALIASINETQKKHIITLEDPIEFVHTSKKSLVHQREIGQHTPTFGEALRSALREDPDIILVGELRDLETMSLAIETAHTGHLVFGTLHTNNVVSTIDRIIDMFPSDQHNQVRSSLSDTLKGIVCQTLCKRIGGGRAAAFEVLVVNNAISNIIRQGKSHQIASSMIGKGNLLLNAHLEELVKTNTIDAREALNKSIDKEDMRTRLGSRLNSRSGLKRHIASNSANRTHSSIGKIGSSSNHNEVKN